MNWKKALGLYAVYKAGQGSRRAPEPRSEWKSAGTWKGTFIIGAALGLIVLIILIKLGV